MHGTPGAAVSQPPGPRTGGRAGGTRSEKEYTDMILEVLGLDRLGPQAAGVDEPLYDPGAGRSGHGECAYVTSGLGEAWEGGRARKKATAAGTRTQVAATAVAEETGTDAGTGQWKETARLAVLLSHLPARPG